MKYILIFYSTIFCFLGLNAQSQLDKALSEISNDLAIKLKAKEIHKIVVLYVMDNNKVNTNAGKYLADIVSINIVNNPNNFLVFNRENLNSIGEAKKLMAEGYINVDDAKELGKLLSVEAIIIGNYTVLSNTIKLTLNCLDSYSGFVTAASMKDLPIDADAAALLGISFSSTDANTTSNMGFNHPLNSNEHINNPETVNKDCTVKNYGDYCFFNNTKYPVRVYVTTHNLVPGRVLAEITLSPGQTQCVYEINSGAYDYNIEMKTQNYYNEYATGMIQVIKCESKSFEIK